MDKGLVALVALLAIVSIAPGCGGDEGGATASLAKAEFIERADAICTRGNQRFQNLYEKYLRESGLGIAKRKRTVAEATEVTRKVLVPAVEPEIAEVRALPAPSGDEKKVEAILDAVEEGLERVEKNPTVVGNTEDEFRNSSALAADYGLEVCGR